MRKYICPRWGAILVAAGTVGCVSTSQTQSVPPQAASPVAPHIDAINLREQVNPLFGSVVVIQEIVFHAPNGNAISWHNEIMQTSTPAPAINLRDGAIGIPKEQQQRGAIVNARYNCGASGDKYSFVKRITIADADGNQSNSVDVTIRCH
jgi:hypothetical protein